MFASSPFPRQIRERVRTEIDKADEYVASKGGERKAYQRTGRKEGLEFDDVDDRVPPRKRAAEREDEEMLLAGPILQQLQLAIAPHVVCVSHYPLILHVCMHAYVCMCAWMNVCVHACMCMPAYMCSCMHACVHR
jgi:hypothetical protein